MGHKWFTWVRVKKLIRGPQEQRSWRSKNDSNGFLKQFGFQRTLNEKSFKSETVRTLYLEKDCQRPVKISLPTFFSNFFYFSFTLLALANHVLHNFFQSRGGKMFQMQLKRALYHLKWCQSCTKSSFSLRSPK